MIPFMGDNGRLGRARITPGLIHGVLDIEALNAFALKMVAGQIRADHIRAVR